MTDKKEFTNKLEAQEFNNKVKGYLETRTNAITNKKTFTVFFKKGIDK